MSIRNIEAIRISQLRVIKSLLATRNVSHTAHEMALTQSAISKTLSMLRTAFDDDIFIKTADGMEPTSLGTSIAAEVEEILASVKRMELISNQFDVAKTTHTLKIASNDFFQNVLIINAIPKIREVAPGLTIEFCPLPHNNMLDPLTTGEVSLLINEYNSKSDNIESEIFAKDDLVVVMANAHALAKKKTLTAKDLAGAEHVQVATENKSNQDLVDALQKLDKSVYCPMTLSSFAPLAPLLARGSQIAVVPRHYVLLFGQFFPLTARPLPFALPPVVMQVNWHRRNRRDPLIVWVLDQLRATFSSWNSAGAA